MGSRAVVVARARVCVRVRLWLGGHRGEEMERTGHAKHGFQGGSQSNQRGSPGGLLAGLGCVADTKLDSGALVDNKHR